MALGGGGGGSAQQQPSIEPLTPPAAEQEFQVKIPALAFTSSADLVGQNADGSLKVFTADLSTTPPTAPTHECQRSDESQCVSGPQ